MKGGDSNAHNYLTVKEQWRPIRAAATRRLVIELP